MGFLVVAAIAYYSNVTSYLAGVSPNAGPRATVDKTCPSDLRWSRLPLSALIDREGPAWLPVGAQRQDEAALQVLAGHRAADGRPAIFLSGVVDTTCLAVPEGVSYRPFPLKLRIMQVSHRSCRCRKRPRRLGCGDNPGCRAPWDHLQRQLRDLAQRRIRVGVRQQQLRQAGRAAAPLAGLAQRGLLGLPCLVASLARLPHRANRANNGCQ
jgi:hypothetical protein